MKKTLLLATMVASLVTIAKTTGNVEFFNDNSFEFKNQKFTLEKLGVNTEVKVDGTGLSFGGTLMAKNTEKANDVPTKVIENSNLYLKYELPQIKGFNSFVKGTASYKNIKFEADVNYEVAKNIKVGLNSSTTFPYQSNNYVSELTSTQKLYTKAFEDKKNEKEFKFRNINASIEAKHSYASVDTLKFVSASANGTYALNKELDLTGKFSFKYNVHNTNEKFKDQYLGDEDLFKFDAYQTFTYIHGYSLNATYKGFANTEISGTGFVHHFLNTDHYVNYGVLANVKYTGVNNLTLTGKTTLSGLSKVASEHHGLFHFATGAKYDYKVNDKFTLSPEFNADAKLYVDNATLKNASLELTPKISAEYKPADSLTIKGSVATPIIFKNNNDDIKSFEYNDTSLKTSLNIKYTW